MNRVNSRSGSAQWHLLWWQHHKHCRGYYYYYYYYLSKSVCVCDRRADNVSCGVCAVAVLWARHSTSQHSTGHQRAYSQPSAPASRSLASRSAQQTCPARLMSHSQRLLLGLLVRICAESLKNLGKSWNLKVTRGKIFRPGKFGNKAIVLKSPRNCV